MSKFDWKVLDRNYEDVIYETYNGIAKITINRPEVRNAFRPKTVIELIDAFTIARDDAEIGVIILTGANHGQGEDKEAFCSGGDQRVRGNGGYVGDDNIPRLNVLDLQHLIRIIPKPVIAMVNGFAIGGGHVLHIVCEDFQNFFVPFQFLDIVEHGPGSIRIVCHVGCSIRQLPDQPSINGPKEQFSFFCTLLCSFNMVQNPTNFCC